MNGLNLGSNSTLRLAGFLLVGTFSCGPTPDPVAPPEAVGILIVSGNDQVQVPGASLFSPLVVQLVDAAGQPVRQGGRSVEWTLTASAGSLVVNVDTTNVQGLATAWWTLGRELGTQRLEAAIQALPPIEFTALARIPGPIVFVSGRTGLIGNEFDGFAGELHAMDEDGTNVMPLSSPSGRVQFASDPMWSPNGSFVLFAQAEGRPAGGVPGLFLMGIHRLDIGTLIQTQVPAGGFPSFVNFYRQPAWSRDGFEIVAYLDPRIGTVNIPPDVSPGQLHIMEEDGTGEDPIPFGVTMASSPHWSPAADQLVFVCVLATGQDICTADPGGANLAVLTNDSFDDDDPRWSPDGTRILFVRDRANDGGVWIMDADGGNISQVLPGKLSSPAWAPDGTRFLVTVETATTQDIHIVDVGTGVATNLTNSAFRDRDPNWRR